MKKTLIIVGAVVAGALAWWLISPLFIDKEVDESLPTNETQQPVQVSQKTTTNLDEQMPDSSMMAEYNRAVEEAAGAPNTDMVEEMSGTDPILLSSGSFVSVGHDGTGDAFLYALTDGKILLRLENLDILNGPDLRVVLSKNTNIRSSVDLGDYLELDTLKGNLGNQNYEIQLSAEEVAQYKSAVIYCKAFRVVFNVAVLQ